MPLDVVQTLCDLVRTPSVNPMGRDLHGPEFLEHRVTDFLQGVFERLRVPWERIPVEPLRENIVARIDGATPLEEGGALLVYEAHQDTVPIDGMTIAPFGGEVRGERVWGRGACDIKGGMAAMLSAFARWAERKTPPPVTLVLACTVNEEHGYSGAARLAQAWAEGGSRLLPRPPDGIIVAEPTSLQVVVAHKGVSRWRCRTRGKAAHSSEPQRGENAIFKMARVLQALEQYQREEAPRRGEHPLVGRPSLSVGLISGGISVNTVPDECVIEIHRRLLPGEDPLAAQRHVIEHVAACCPGEAPEHDPLYLAGGGLANDINESLAERLCAAARRHADASVVGVQYGTNAAASSAAGVPSVVFGPGHIAQAHTKDEWIEIEQLHRAVEVYDDFVGAFGPH
jgi:acetylornithine deacetylase/succinyl-diaminopimelate desuccinylase-like protein